MCIRDRALSAWPEEGSPANAVVLAESTKRLLESVEHIATRRMLWVASSVADALRDGALPATAVLRQAYASVSRAVRSSQQEGGVGAAAPSQEPTRQPVSYTHLDVYKRQGEGGVLGDLDGPDGVHHHDYVEGHGGFSGVFQSRMLAGAK